MSASLIHRGPDEEGYLEEKGLYLGHRRLKIIDLQGGQQPMTSHDGAVSLVFNGEIYNFKEIRYDLEKRGKHFVTHSDTESLLKLYEEKGIQCLQDLEGMFAFAIYDRRRKTLYLAVDRFGKKPLYYAEKNKIFLFGSEMKSLLCHPVVSKEIDPAALSEYLAFEYVPAPKTILKGIHKLESGTYLEVNEKGIQRNCYWRHDFSLVTQQEGEWRASFVHLLKSAVRKRLVCDVPLGVFLSGGLDSSAIVAMVRQVEPARKIKTFTIGFSEADFDESRYARKISNEFATEHVQLECSLQKMLKGHEVILSNLDEPLADASFIPTFMLCQLARQHVTVALSGDGGDELFGGYPTFIADPLARYLDHLPEFYLRIIHKIVDAFPVSLNNLSFDFRLKQFFKGMNYSGFERNQVWLGSFSDKEQESILSAELRENAKKCYQVITKIFSSSATTNQDPLQLLQQFYFQFYLQGDILVKVDRASMSNSLEVRSPLLDDLLVQKMIQMGPSLKVKGWQLKYLFKKGMEGILPKEIIDRKKKGFGIPIAKWIREDLRDSFENTLSQRELNKDGFFNPVRVKAILEEHLSGKKDNRKQLWTLYVFQKWKKQWLE